MRGQVLAVGKWRCGERKKGTSADEVGGGASRVARQPTTTTYDI